MRIKGTSNHATNKRVDLITQKQESVPRLAHQYAWPVIEWQMFPLRRTRSVGTQGYLLPELGVVKPCVLFIVEKIISKTHFFVRNKPWVKYKSWEHHFVNFFHGVKTQPHCFFAFLLFLFPECVCMCVCLCSWMAPANRSQSIMVPKMPTCLKHKAKHIGTHKTKAKDTCFPIVSILWEENTKGKKDSTMSVLCWLFQMKPLFQFLPHPTTEAQTLEYKSMTSTMNS